MKYGVAVASPNAAMRSKSRLSMICSTNGKFSIDIYHVCKD